MNMVTFARFDSLGKALAAGQQWVKAVPGITMSIDPPGFSLNVDQDAIQGLDLHKIRRIKARAHAAARRAK